MYTLEYHCLMLWTHLVVLLPKRLATYVLEPTLQLLVITEQFKAVYWRGLPYPIWQNLTVYISFTAYKCCIHLISI